MFSLDIRKKPTSTAQRVLQVVLGTILMSTGLFLAVFFGPDRLEEAAATHQWTPVVATVTDVASELHSGRRGRSSWYVTVAYEYEVDGTVHSSDRWTSAGIRSASTREEADALTAAYSVGDPLNVLVDPQDPTLAVVEAGGENNAWAIINFGALFAAAGAYMFFRGLRQSPASSASN